MGGEYNPNPAVVRVTLPSAGEVVAGRYKILRELGKGGFGAVYHATQLGIEKEVALKILLPSAASMEGASERFRREAMLSKELTHPNTISLHDYGGTADGLTYIAMEYLEGVTLEDEIKASEGGMSIERTRHIITQILKSLNEAHSRTIVHRDLKPANIMLVEVFGESDFVKVLDFGIARAFEDHAEDYKTKTGTVIGTPQYMSPEQLKGADVGPTSDIYSLGLIMAEMLCGKTIYDLENTNLVIVAQLSDPTCPIPAHVTEGNLGHAVYTSCHKDPAQRFQTALDMIEGLKHDAAAPVMGADGVMQLAQPGQVINSTGSRKAAKGKSKAPLIAVAALLLIAAATGAFFVATGGSGGGGENNNGAQGTVATGDDNSQNNDSADNNGDNNNVALVDPNQQQDPGPSEAHVAAERSAGTVANGTWRHANMMTMAIAAPQAVAGTIRLVLISDPIGAEVFRNTAGEGEEPNWIRLGVTPLNAEVDSGAMEVLKLTKSGFQEHYLPVDMSTTAIPPTVELTALARTASERTTRRDSERSSSRERAETQEETPPQGGIGVIDEVGQTDEERAREERRRERRRERQRREREERERENAQSEEGLEIL